MLLLASLQAPSLNHELRSAPARVFEALPYVCLALASILYLLPFARVLSGLPDEGVSEYGAIAVLNGALPGREFVELYGPGSYYWLALFFRIFGASVFVARGFLIAECVVTALLIFHLSRRLGGAGLFAAVFTLSVSLPVAALNTPHYDANMFALLSFTLFLAAERQFANPLNHAAARSLLFLAGTIAGWTSCIMQQKGLLFAASFALSIVVLRPRRALAPVSILFAGYSLPIAAELAFYAFHGALHNLMYANLVLPASLYFGINAVSYGAPLWTGLIPVWFTRVRTMLPAPLALICVGVLAVPFVFILALPVLLPALGYFRRSQALGRDRWPWWLAACALWLSELHRLDLGHLRNGSLLFAVLFFALCETSANALLRQAPFVIAACSVLLAYGIRDPSHYAIHTRRGDLLNSKPDKALEFLMENTGPGEDVFLYPYDPVYYFLAGVHNPTRLAAFIYDPAADELFREAVHAIDSKKVRYVLWDTALAGENLRSLFPAYHPPPREKLIIEPYLETHYHQIGLADDFRILERNR